MNDEPDLTLSPDMLVQATNVRAIILNLPDGPAPAVHVIVETPAGAVALILETDHAWRFARTISKEGTAARRMLRAAARAAK